MPPLHGVGSARPNDDFISDPIVVAYGAGVDSTAVLIGLTTTRGLGRCWSWSEYLGHGDPSIPLVQ
jgi:hypothetical protein